MLVRVISTLEHKEQLIRFRVYGNVATSAQTDGRLTTVGPLYTGSTVWDQQFGYVFIDEIPKLSFN